MTSKLAVDEPGFWKVKKVINVSDVKGGCIELNKEEVEEHILKPWNFLNAVVKTWNGHKIMRACYETVKVLDLDKGTEHSVWFIYDRKKDSYYFGGGPRNWDLVERRWLSIGHEVGIAYDPEGQRLLFRVLKRGDASGSKF